MKPAYFSAPLIARQWLSDNTIELSLQCPTGFKFAPGQRVRIYHETLERDYSLAAGPGEPELKLVIRVFPQGRVSTFLSTVAIGSPISFYGPMGYFVFRSSERTPVFVATGTGVAPFLAMCRAGVKGYICLHGAQHSEGLFYAVDLEKNAVRYVPCLSRGPVSDESGFSGRVTDYLGRLDTSRAYDFYLCGQQSMIREAFQIIDERFAGAYVHSEVFY